MEVSLSGAAQALSPNINMVAAMEMARANGLMSAHHDRAGLPLRLRLLGLLGLLRFHRLILLLGPIE